MRKRLRATASSFQSSPRSTTTPPCGATATLPSIDGPFAETKELLAGYWLWQVKSLDEAIEWVKRIPNPDDGTEVEVEIRPVFEADDFGDSLTPELREQEARLREQAEANR